MHTLFHPQSYFLHAHQTRCRNHIDLLRLQFQTPVVFPVKDRGRWIREKPICLAAKAQLDWATNDQLGLSESDMQSPTISSSYRRLNLSKPNQTVLEAQARVCTGPTQTRPLGEEQASKVLDTILRSNISGEDERIELLNLIFLQFNGGVTEEQMLKFMGANTNLFPLHAKKLLEDEEVGFAYVSQREARPSLYEI